MLHTALPRQRKQLAAPVQMAGSVCATEEYPGAQNRLDADCWTSVCGGSSRLQMANYQCASNPIISYHANFWVWDSGLGVRNIPSAS